MTADITAYNSRLFSYLDSSPTAYHAVAASRELLLAATGTELLETQPWELQKGRLYFVVRDHSALVAFVLGSKEEPEDGFRMMASHSDSPGLKLTPNPLLATHPYLQLGVEIYGGPLLNPWFDRDLSLAGRVSCVDGKNQLLDRLVDFARPLLCIPSLAIHFDREANNGRAIDRQKSLPPLLGQIVDDQLPHFHDILLRQLCQQYPDLASLAILAFDLFCYDRQEASALGLNHEFICASRLDNLLSCHAATEAIGAAGTEQNTLFLCTNHEENGSTSISGANGTFVDAVFRRMVTDPEKREIALRKSFLLSIDNAHAVHPNFKDRSAPQHDITMNGGPVIKINANQRYATSSRSAARFRHLAAGCGVPVQQFVMRSDLPCGSTIGPMTAARLGVETVDIGAPTLAMHSIREMTGRDDPHLLFRCLLHFLRSAPSRHEG